MRLLPLPIFFLCAVPSAGAADAVPKAVVDPAVKAPTAAEKAVASQKWLDALEGDWKGDSKAALNGRELRINVEESYHRESVDGVLTLVGRSRIQIDLMATIETSYRFHITKDGDIEGETTSVDASGEKKVEKGPIRIVGGGAFSKSIAPDGTLVSYYSEKMIDADGVKVRKAMGMTALPGPEGKPLKLRYDQTLKKAAPDKNAAK